MAVVFVDILRATTTLLAVAAAGCRGIYVDVKPADGIYLFVPPAHLPQANVWVFGGELNGEPITGIDAKGNRLDGIISNSPIDVAEEKFDGKHLRFFSTNGSRVLQAVIAGGMPIICAMAMANIDVTVEYILRQSPERIWFTCGGFYGSQSLEDSVASGVAISRLVDEGYATEDELDDEAQSMLILARFFLGAGGLDTEHLVAQLSRGQVGQLLSSIGHRDDIKAAVDSSGIDEAVKERMRTTVLEVRAALGPFVLPISSNGVDT